MRFGSGVAFFSLSLWCVGFPLPILLSSLPNVHNAIRSIGPKLGHPALQKTEGSDAGFSWWETTEGHYTRLRKTSSRISTLNNSRVSLRDCLEASCMAVRRVEQRKLSKHKKAPPPKTIAALFDVIGWCWPQSCWAGACASTEAVGSRMTMIPNAMGRRINFMEQNYTRRYRE